MAIRYVTRRELLIERQQLLADQIRSIEVALKDLIEGRITSYNIGSFSVGRSAADIDKLHNFLKELEAEFLENNNVLHGRSRRVTEYGYYQNPTNIRRYW
jgi:hypothetical protein